MANQSSDSIAGANFKRSVVQKILQEFIKDDKMKINKEALTLVTELLKIFVAETAARCINEAKNDHMDEITIEHFEKILPQLLLDF